MQSLIVVSLIWAFSFGLIRRYLTSLDSATVACLRLALSCLVFAPWLRPRLMTQIVRWKLMGIGALQFGLMYLLYIEAFHYLYAYQVAMLTLFTPLFVSLFDGSMARRFSALAISAALLAALGAMIVVGFQPVGHTAWRGILLVQASNAAFALGQLLYRRFRLLHTEHSDRLLMPWLYLGAMLSALPVAAPTAVLSLTSMTTPQWVVVIYLGVIASGFGFYLWNSGSARVSAAALAVMNNAKIPLGVLVSVVVFRETINAARLVVGTMIIGVGFAIAQRHRSPR
ncbi:MAG TPA: EamA family transporter [Polyangiaceae bacterium]